MRYLEGIGWKWKQIGGVFVSYRRLPLFNRHLFKIQRVKGVRDLSELIEFAKEIKTLAIVVEPHFDDFDEGVYDKYGFCASRICYAPSATLQIDLGKSEDGLWKEMSENARRNAKFASRSKIKIDFVDDYNGSEFIDQMYEQWRHVSDLRKFHMPSRKEILIKYEALKKLTVFSKATDSEGEVLACVWFVVFGNCVTYLHAGNSDKGYECKANFLLVWESIKYFKQRGYAVFDFESFYDKRYPRTTKRWKGFSEFKSKFGGEVKYYPAPRILHFNSMFRYLSLIGEALS